MSATLWRSIFRRFNVARLSGAALVVTFLTAGLGCKGETPMGAKRVALLLAQASCACSGDSSCVANEVRRQKRWVDNGLAQGRFFIDGATLQACKDQIQACQASMPACDALLQGGTPPKAACTESAECAGDAFCRWVPEAADSSTCPGLGACEPRVGRGKPCTHSQACSGGLTCVASPEPGVGVCADPVSEGGRCFFESVDRESVYARCKGGRRLVCGADGTCTRTARKAPRGASCTFDFDCAARDFCEGGRCAARLRAGESCSGADQCARDLTCRKSVCTRAAELERGCDPTRGNADCLSPWICSHDGVCRDAISVCFEEGTPADVEVPDGGGGGGVTPRSALGNACVPGDEIEEEELFCSTSGVLQGVIARRCAGDPGLCVELDGPRATCLPQGLCARSCASDIECAFGLRCDRQLAVCTR